MLLISLTAFAALFLLRPTPMADLLVYRAEGRAVLDGTDLYGFRVTEWKLPATYPPFAALLFVPAALPPLLPLKAAFAVANVLLLALLVHLSLRLAAPAPGTRLAARPRGALVLGATALGLWLEPVFQTMLFGQINLALACLVLWDLTRPDSARGKGLAIGIAAGIKLTPAIFAVYLLLTGRVRAALWSFAGFAGTVLAGVAVLPGASLEFWTRRMLETRRVGRVWIVDNQSLQGLFARLLHTTDPGTVWRVAALVTAVAGLLLARHAVRAHGHEAWGVLCTALTAVLVSPISWSHHWVWCVPLLVLLAVEAGPRPRPVLAVAAAVLFTARSHWLVPHDGTLDLRLPWWLQPAGSPYPLLGLGLLLFAAWRLRGTPEGAPPGSAAGAPGLPGPRQTSSPTSSPASSPAASSSDASTMR
ncbi:glycosyltransferase 87 family protein [Streptomyces sp. F63]|uniref:glycosyltransferase 87 family protein n=1 Tax=Streptomyces sp. F63 TaxID=2824887 RepID=UPI0027DD0333|nr:glycosyltransferase 87 family protein [Streptomyces sp. F63]